MIKKKSILYKIFVLCMVACFAFLGGGCIGQPGDAGDGLEGEDIIGDLAAVDLYGTKVLYRPDNYDYNAGSGAAEGEINDYYGQYAFYILRDLFTIYGLSNENNVNGEYGRLPDFADENLVYLYDSIRYQTNMRGVVTQIVDESGATSELTNPLYILGADTSVRWQWTMEANTSREDLKAYIYSSINGEINMQDGDEAYIILPMDTTVEGMLTDYYNTNISFSGTDYTRLYLTSSESTEVAEQAVDYDNYSDYVKTLEYVIYCYAVDLPPNEVTVETYDDGSYDVQIEGYSSVDEALADAQHTFTILGSYVGLVDRQIENIKNWILDNVIGETARSDSDSFTIYNGVTAYLNASGEITRFTLGGASSTYALGRNYETAVENIIVGVCENVPIGSYDGEIVTINNRFLASHIMEYAGDLFLIADDSNFPAESLSITQLQPLEYQSAVLMFDEEIDLSCLTIALKYDADLDGTEEGVYDSSKFLEIIVDINYYNSTSRTRQVLASKRVKVYDGPYDENYLNDGTGNSGDGTIAPLDHTSALLFDFEDSVHVGRFSTDVGGGALMTDVGTVGHYTSEPFVSTNPLVLLGTTNVRNFYEVVEYGSNPEYDTDVLGENKTYISGRLNPNTYSENNGSDYIEITYKVIKEAGDADTNYKFYTGIAFIA